MIVKNQEIPTTKSSKKILQFKCDDCNLLYERRWDSRINSNLKQGKDLCRSCANKNSFNIDINKNYDNIKIENSYTITCKKCQKEFKVPKHEKNRIFCSKKCQISGIKRSKNLNITNCLICNKEFSHYGERIVCSRECLSEYMSEKRLNENNPSWIENKETNVCKRCNESFEYTRRNLHKGQKRVFCSLACSRNNGNNKEFIENNDNNYKYPRVFNNKLKNRIKDRDGHKCQLCSSEKNLEIHHIDYDKKNCEDDNLITLCKKCHNITNHNRGFWLQVFIGLQSNSKIVKKGWGLEIHIVNHNEYCLKYLIFFNGKKFSWHKHLLKKELWVCMWGKFECVINTNEHYEYLKLSKGDKIEILPSTEHQVQALTNSILMEVSTKDFLEDSIRIEKGD